SGDAPGAVARFRRALEISAARPTAASNLLFALNYDFDRNPESIFAEHAAWGRGLARGLPPAAHANDCSPERRLRIGYLSPDFRDHALAYFIEPVLAQHDRTCFEVICYSDALREDGVTARLRRQAA